MAHPVFRIEDGNESICGACLQSGMLICCEHCPAAFHPECAGYADISCVPEGDWFCFLCSRKLGLKFDTGDKFLKSVGQEVMVMCDEHGEVFSKGVITDITEARVTVRLGGRCESFALGDQRLWHGTLKEASWMPIAENEYRPNSRAFEIDYQKIASQQDTPKPAKQESAYVKFLREKKAHPREKHFIDLLTHFWKVQIGTDGIQWPSFGYFVPLADLWDLVQNRGGYQSVCEKSGWEEIGQEMCPFQEHVHFAFILKHTFQTVLLDVENNGGVEAMEIMKRYTPLPEKKNRHNGDDREDGVSTKRTRREKRRKKNQLPTADAWFAESLPADVLTHSSSRVWPQVFSASRAVQEYRKAIGIVSLTDMAKNLCVGGKVDVRLYKDCSLGPWRVGRIQAIATASAFEGYRRFRIKFGKSKDAKMFPSVSEQWVTLLARPSAWGTTLPRPSVLVRPVTKPYFPPVKPAIAEAHVVGDRVEAWLHNGWWPASIVSIRDHQALLQGDVIPLGEGLKWISTLDFVRTAQQGENEGYGMIQPLKMNEPIYPKEMERKLNVTVDKSIEGKMILSFKRLDQRPSRR